ncbi:MAG: hypothetical protein ACFWUE_11200 [Xylanivirga thermophila]|jgi:hypothetical protein|uniref:PilN domain-containing protein n=1 Tax=Xylanivirga thermophila TaxID=2496273 RepID=UPI00101D4098|nr:PilN domain-containing protein [Xylanivirga thermophila]
MHDINLVTKKDVKHTIMDKKHEFLIIIIFICMCFCGIYRPLYKRKKVYRQLEEYRKYELEYNKVGRKNQDYDLMLMGNEQYKLSVYNEKVNSLLSKMQTQKPESIYIKSIKYERENMEIEVLGTRELDIINFIKNIENMDDSIKVNIDTITESDQDNLIAFVIHIILNNNEDGDEVVEYYNEDRIE